MAASRSSRSLPKSRTVSFDRAGLLAHASSSGVPSQPSRPMGDHAFVRAHSRGKTAPDLHRTSLFSSCVAAPVRMNIQLWRGRSYDGSAQQIHYSNFTAGSKEILSSPVTAPGATPGACRRLISFILAAVSRMCRWMSSRMSATGRTRNFGPVHAAEGTGVVGAAHRGLKKVALPLSRWPIDVAFVSHRCSSVSSFMA